MSLTLFSCPKPFKDPHTDVIQRNAISSWRLLRPKPEIILFGQEEGVAQICREWNLRHVPGLVRNKFGTPLFSDFFEKAQQAAAFDWMCHVNTDILLMSDFMQAVEAVRKWRNRFLATGIRCNLDMPSEWDFHQLDWEQKLRDRGTREGERQSLAADYFVFPRWIFQNIPPLRWGERVMTIGCFGERIKRICRSLT